MSGESECVEEPMNGSGSDHQTWIHGPAHNPSEGIPGELIEPVQKVVEIRRHHLISGAIVEPGVEFVNNRLETRLVENVNRRITEYLETDDGEKSGEKAKQGHPHQDGQGQQGGQTNLRRKYVKLYAGDWRAKICYTQMQRY